MHVGSKHSCHRSAAVAPRLALTGVKGWMQPCLFLCPFLLLRVALTLRSLRIHTPRLCRFAVLYYKPTFLPHQGVAKRLITNRIRQTVALGLISTRPCYCLHVEEGVKIQNLIEVARQSAVPKRVHKREARRPVRGRRV